MAGEYEFELRAKDACNPFFPSFFFFFFFSLFLCCLPMVLSFGAESGSAHFLRQRYALDRGRSDRQKVLGYKLQSVAVWVGLHRRVRKKQNRRSRTGVVKNHVRPYLTSS